MIALIAWLFLAFVFVGTYARFAARARDERRRQAELTRAFRRGAP